MQGLPIFFNLCNPQVAFMTDYRSIFFRLQTFTRQPLKPLTTLQTHNQSCQKRIPGVRMKKTTSSRLRLTENAFIKRRKFNCADEIMEELHNIHLRRTWEGRPLYDMSPRSYECARQSFHMKVWPVQR